ncbi:MAG: xylulokinase, partial [Clostridiaceae bacterium]|nr:xylulokinase [Clostridiaceae bacterium]
SDVFNLPISTLDKNEGAAFGAAILAGTGAGVYESVKAAAKVIKQSGKFYPNEENVKVYEKLYGKYTTLYEKIKDI